VTGQELPDSDAVPLAHLAETVSFDLLGEELGHDVNTALRTALCAGAVFPRDGSPLAHFRQAIADATVQISVDRRWDLFKRFLKYGPQDVEDTVPKPERLTQVETATVISFIWGHAVNSFQGAIAELLATAPSTRILQTLQQEGRLPREARLYVGDAVLARRERGAQFAKGADLHLLVALGTASASPSVLVLGVGEVKSGLWREANLQQQLTKHITRARRGLRILGKDYLPEAIRLGHGPQVDVVRISVVPDRWHLPRGLRSRPEGDARVPEVIPGSPSSSSDEIIRVSDTEWRVVLRWSREALAAAAYEMTFWWMSKIGEIIYEDGVPQEWSGMTRAEAGYNAAKEKLYYAIRPYAVKAEESKEPGKPKLTRKEVLEMQRAIALYNSYGFGYMLGMNFRNRAGKREMLWPQDLDEIMQNGQTKRGCRIR
jgi:hypothetical protein